MENLADKIYNKLLDMDFLDYEETREEEQQSLMEDLKLLKTQGNGTLLNVIEMLMED